MRGTLAHCLALAACGGPGTTHVAGAPGAHDIARGDMFFDCDAAAGHISQWSRAIEPAGSVTGALFVTEARYHPDWKPFARVAITGADANTRAGIEVTLGKTATTLLAHLRVPGDTRSIELARAPTSGARFELKWAGQTLQVRTAPTTPWMDVPLGFVPERIWLECSSSDAVFHDVTITTTPASESSVSSSSAVQPIR